MSIYGFANTFKLTDIEDNIDIINSDLDNIDLSLSNKANLNHTHSIANVTNLQTSLDGKANTVHTHAISDVTNLQSSLDAKLNLSGGTMSGAIAMATNKITGLGNGTVSTDAVNKSQLDLMLPLAGGLMQGNLNFNNNNLSGVYDLTVSNNLAVTGNLTVNGSASTINTTNLAVSDPLTRVADTNPADTVDIGMYGKYVSSGTKYTGIFRDASDSGKYKYFHGLTEEPTTVINTSGTGYAKSDIVVGGIDCTSIIAPSITNSSDITMNSTSGNINLQQNAVQHASFTPSSLITRSNIGYTISHATNAGSQDFTILKTGADTSRIIVHSAGTGADSILIYTPSGGINLSSSSLLINGTTLTSTATELNKLSGVTTTATEFNRLAGLTAVASDLNKIAGVTNGTASASKAMTMDSNKNITGLTSLRSDILRSSEYRMEASNYSQFIFSDQAYVSFHKSTDVVSGGMLETLDEQARLTNSGKFLVKSAFGSISGGTVLHEAPSQFTGYGPSTSGTLSTVINTSSTITNVTSSISMISVSTANSGRCLTRLSYTGSLLPWQRITLSNKSGVTIVLGHLAVLASGAIAGWWYELYNNMQVDLVYDSAFDRFICPGIEPPIGKWKSLRWSEDQSLGLFVSSAYTYTVKINFANSNTTINTVSGFENIAAGTNSGTGWSRTVSGSHLDYNTANGRWLTDTESAKLVNFTYNDTATTFTFTGLTNGNLYGLFIYCMVFANDVRSQILQEDSTGIKDQVSTQLYATNSGSNEPAMVNMFLWRHMTSATTKAFTFTNVSVTAHRYAITVINLGAV